MNIKLIDDAHCHVIDHVVETLRMIIEGGYGRQNHDSHARQLQHVLEMYLIDGRLAHHADQFASLFQNDVGSAMDQVVAEPVRNRRERAHAAGSDDHSECHKRAAGDRGALIAAAVTPVSYTHLRAHETPE